MAEYAIVAANFDVLKAEQAHNRFDKQSEFTSEEQLLKVTYDYAFKRER